MSGDGRDTGLEFNPKFGADGLITAVVSQFATGEPLMVAHMNREALEKSLATGEAHFWSRSREEIWHKGATSGNVLTIRDIRIDCDQDAIWLSVEIAGQGAACHTGRKSCFYRKVAVTDDSSIVLRATDNDPQKVYSSSS